MINFVFEVAAVVAPPSAVVFLVAFFWPRGDGLAAAATLIFGALAGIMLWIVAQASVIPPDWLKPVLVRAGVNGLASLIVLLFGTVAIPQNPARVLRSGHHVEPLLVASAGPRTRGRGGAPQPRLLVGGDAVGRAGGMDRRAVDWIADAGVRLMSNGLPASACARSRHPGSQVLPVCGLRSVVFDAWRPVEVA